MAEEVVRVRDLVKRYGDLLALDHLDLSVGEGEIFGLLGPNGSGKSTAIGCLLALLTYDRGTIEVFGREMTPSAYDLKKRIGVVFQDVAVFEQMSVYENIDYFCGLYVKDKARRKQLVDEAITFTGLEEQLKKRPRQLSGGLLRRLNIACGIAHQPELIIMDEPTVAVDPQSRNHILEGIRELNRKGSTVIYTTHYMEEAEQLCTRLTIIDRGRSVAAGTSEELKAMIKTGETVTIEGIALDAAHLETIRSMPDVFEVSYRDGTLKIRFSGGRNHLVEVLHGLEREKITFGRVFSEQPTLNDVFLEITGKELRE
ncbi:MAG: ABC transporter ATP-binding protein [Lachnospiraceae bacterium]|jgi:ABC-2 type transport system ATP-binding protein|nr:ABC transporter ATP-binding protein [Lachnospiraceae bacterium]MCI1333905.1 ABC transporter ATP-binding protein [Lachnospiraceae bacterium]MCI1358074.1 ABC transporter ATP-binding protein [Lachnospiraceae bacterium]MCI1378016.1 ABC transporter ATP-binding protein [Lachnospiraceae bacterium]MCI1454666.1 ABC transporter ATP-binding protein [Lachnospiraceae bacterium]